MPTSPTWHGVGLTDRGRVRSTNQDAYAVLDELRTWVVADGMGGHAGGDVASRLAVETVGEHLRGAPRQGEERLLLDALTAAQESILARAQSDPALAGMGTTCVVATIPAQAPLHATIAHIGDSRAYRFRDGRLDQLTRDHSLVDEYVRRGLLTAEAARRHPLRHVLSRALGMQDSFEPEAAVHELVPSDLLLLCTDGLSKMLPDDRICDILRREAASPGGACRALVEEALRCGGEDNVTVVVCAARG